MAELIEVGRITGSLGGMGELTGNLSGTGQLVGDMSLPEYVGNDPYTGAYEFTPTEEIQTIAIRDKRATENIIINPIPSDYGKITWNGSTLTVS